TQIPTFAQPAFLQSLDQTKNFIMKATCVLGGWRMSFWTIQNGGAGGRISAGRYLPSLAGVSCHLSCSLLGDIRFGVPLPAPDSQAGSWNASFRAQQA